MERKNKSNAELATAITMELAQNRLVKTDLDKLRDVEAIVKHMIDKARPEYLPRDPNHSVEL